MVKYIAAKPVRLDRDYAVGEEIPAAAIDPKMEKRLISWGKIQRITTPDTDDAAGGEQNTPQTNMFGGNLQASVENLEALLGISYSDGSTPTLEERIEICKTRSAELNKPATADERILGREPGNGGGTQTPADPQKKTADTPQNENGIKLQGGDATPQDEAEAATNEAATEETTGGSSFICEVCGKVCGSKAALTTHTKTHNQG